MTQEPIIQLDDVVVRDARSKRTILDHVNVSIDGGDQIGLVGPSGSGKTTLMRALAKLDPWHRGMLWFRGQQVEKQTVPAYRSQVIYLSQKPAFAATTVRDNLALPFTFLACSKAQDLDAAVTLLGRLGKQAGILDQSMESLSGGECQIVSIVRAIMLAPLVLLLDEPTSALDVDTALRLEQIVMEWRKADDSRAYIWTSHNRDQVCRMTTRQIEMKDGKASIQRRFAS